MCSVNEPPHCVKRKTFSHATFSNLAYEQSRRHGAPASVVDPLIALLMRLRRIENSIINVLESFGVSSEELERNNYIFHDSVGKSMKHPATFSSTNDFNINSNNNLEVDSLKPLDQYIMEHKLRVSKENFISDELYNNTNETWGACIKAILRWVDDVSPLESIPNIDLSRDELVSRLILITKESESSLSLNSKKRKRSKEIPKDFVISFREHWEHYANQLKTTYWAEYSLIKAICATDTVKSIRFHSKLVEIDKGQLKDITTPAAVLALRKNCNDLKIAKDTLSEYQKKVSVILSSLEDAIDEYTDKIPNIVEREENFWSNLSLAELECKALNDLSHRVKSIIKNL